jgi:hypothetical protein
VESIIENLSSLINYKFSKVTGGIENSPFYNVYSLLDGIGKKLDWPPINSIANSQMLRIESKVTLLFSLKAKLTQNDPVITKLNISLSSLNKQISFYGIAFFFHKLTELSALCKQTFSRGIVLASEAFFVDQSIHDTNNDNAIQDVPASLALISDAEQKHNATVAILIVCVKLWEKFNQHKEISTIITKCLSNSKLDTIAIYKTFLTDYYTNGYLLALNPKPPLTNSLKWDSLKDWTCKQRIPIVAYLFMNEKKTFEPFFKAFGQILADLPTKSFESGNAKFDYQILSKMSFIVFELNKQNVLRYFFNLISEKLKQVSLICLLTVFNQFIFFNSFFFIKLSDSKKSLFSDLLTKNDQFIGLILVIAQSNLENLNISSAASLYDTAFRTIKANSSFDYPDFFTYIYGNFVFKFFSQLKKSLTFII